VAAAASWYRLLEGALEVRVRVQPRSSRKQIAGVLGDRLKVLVTAPPVDGAANEAVLALLAAGAGLSRRAASIAAGATGRSKTVRLEADDPAAVVARLEALVRENR